MPDEQRLKSFENVEKYIKELKKLDNNFSVQMKKVNEVGGIKQEHVLLYKGKSLKTQLPPRANSLFGYLIYNDKGEKVNLKTEIVNRIKTDKEKDILTNYLLGLREGINNELKQERTKQANREQNAKKE